MALVHTHLFTHTHARKQNQLSPHTYFHESTHTHARKPLFSLRLISYFHEAPCPNSSFDFAEVTLEAKPYTHKHTLAHTKAATFPLAAPRKPRRPVQPLLTNTDVLGLREVMCGI